MYLLDTDIVSNLIKPKPSPYLVTKLKNTPPMELSISVITLMELYAGYFLSKKPDTIKRFIEEWVVETLTIIDFDVTQSILAARIQIDLKKKGKTLDWLDVMIASAALVNGCTLITGNLQHFKRIEGLKVENWL